MALTVVWGVIDVDPSHPRGDENSGGRVSSCL